MRHEVFPRIMIAVQQGMITPAPTPVQVEEPAERVAPMLPSATPSVTANRTPEPVTAPDVPPTPTAANTARPTDTLIAQTPVSAPTDIPALTTAPTMSSTPTSTYMPIPTLTPAAPTFTPVPIVTLTPTVTPTPTSTPTLEPTATATTIPTATTTPTLEERELATIGTPPEHLAYAWWDWDYQNPLRNQQGALNEITVEIEIHNDIELNGAGNGIYLMVCSGDVDGMRYYFGLQTDVHNYNLSDPYAGKGLLFSRWGERDLENARIPSDGWTQSSGHEGNFIGVRRNYDWGAGKYLLRIGQDGPDDSGGRWYELWITNLAINQETWIGSMRFPYIGGRALLGPRCYNTVEIYGPPIAPRDIPYWKVTLNPPEGDGKASTVTDDGFSPFTGSYRNTRFSYDENGAVIYEVGLDHIPPTGERPAGPVAPRDFYRSSIRILRQCLRPAVDGFCGTSSIALSYLY